MSKKPDLVVFDEETQQYDAALRAYGTSASAPSIKPLNTSTWRNDGITKVNQQFKSKFNELKKEFDEMMNQFEYNDLVYNATFNFEPIIGEIYYLYHTNNSEPFLSIISPEQCNFNHLGTFRLTSQKMWEKL
ncbi:MAG: Uncharacterised protein [Flavobacterium sp. SCGC AAA160-P02]|nr:MAG: Uncharacterised protein [Flavobacterium sp. SCGC AAA160-P02]